MKRITLWLKDEHLEFLENRCVELDSDLSKQIRKAVQQYIEKLQNTEEE